MSEESAVVVQTKNGIEMLSEKNLALDKDALKLYDIARVWASSNEINANSIIDFTTTLIRSIQEIVTEGGEGKRKKHIVLTVLRLVITNDAPSLSEADRQTILGLIDVVIPPIIDTIVGVATGRIDIAKEWNKYFSTCCPCLPIAPKPKSKKLTL